MILVIAGHNKWYMWPLVGLVLWFLVAQTAPPAERVDPAASAVTAARDAGLPQTAAVLEASPETAALFGGLHHAWPFLVGCTIGGILLLLDGVGALTRAARARPSPPGAPRPG